MSDGRILEQPDRLHLIWKDLRKRSGYSRRFDSLIPFSNSVISA